MSKAVIFFAQGLEECEALLCVDILRRAGVEVTIAAVGGERIVTSARQVNVVADALAEELDALRRAVRALVELTGKIFHGKNRCAVVFKTRIGIIKLRFRENGFYRVIKKLFCYIFRVIAVNYAK